MTHQFSLDLQLSFPVIEIDSFHSQRKEGLLSECLKVLRMTFINHWIHQGLLREDGETNQVVDPLSSLNRPWDSS